MNLPVNTIEKEIEFAQDTEERRRWFRAASFSHPAKMVLGLQIYLIEHYTKVGETILDPMAGSGTVLVGCALGRNIICVELEQKFVDMQKANWEKIKSLGPMLGYKMGEATVLQGDARQLQDLLMDKCIFSPPYAETLQKGKSLKERTDGMAEMLRKERPYSYDKTGADSANKGCGDNDNNISYLPYGEISAVISSPPHGNRLSDDACKDNDPQRMSYRQALGKADAVITSPPYEQSLTDGHTKKRTDGTEFGYADVDESVERLRNHGRTNPKAGGPYGRSLGHPYSGAAENIGNLKSDNYLEAMLLVYQNCYKVLRDGGLLCLVVKNFIRDKKIVRLDLDTIKLCEKVGFILKERLKRKLTSQSFWRIIYQRKFPDAPKIEFEDILIFAKVRPAHTV